MSRREKKEKFKTEDKRPQLQPKNFMQKEYIRAIIDNQMVVVMGPAGTGKTFISATIAAQEYYDGRIDKIILTRPNISPSESLGFFPGTLEEKMAPWVAPFTDVIRKQLGDGAYETMLKNGNLEIAPFETMRGRSFEDAYVILDEAQNTTAKEMEMFVTRIGENSRVIVNGDVMQSDIHGDSGLKTIIRLIGKYQMPVPIIEFQVNDIVRSKLCKMWIEAFINES